MRKALRTMSMTAGQSTSHRDVLVIGAGISGLACASKLFQHEGFRHSNSLAVIEGRDRIGGRIANVQVNGSRLDIGANWIHGAGTAARPNPVMGIVPNMRSRELSGVVAFKGPSAKGDAVANANFDSQAVVDQVIPAQIAGVLSAGLWDAIGGLHKKAQSISPEEAQKTTILDTIIQTKGFKDTYEALDDEHASTFGSMLQFVENIEAGPLAKHSLERPEGSPGMSLLEYQINDFEGDQVFVQDGCTTIIEHIAKDLIDADLVKLNTTVTQIDWNSKPIKVHTNQGVYTADQVVCTLPLGVLKDDKDRIFQPRLPSMYSTAIESLGFGTLDKIFLVYKSAWWTEEPFLSILKKGLVKETSQEDDVRANVPDSFMGFTDELPGIQIDKNGGISPSSYNLSMINLHSLTGFPVISCFVSCATALKIEKMSNKAVGEIIHRSLVRGVGREPPSPEAVHVTRWAEDPFSKGSYSHMIANLSTAAHRETFGLPVMNEEGAELRFAGEHTSIDHFAVVHGALLSGWREADAILKHVDMKGDV